MDHFYVFFFNDTATTEIYTLSLHDALPISFIMLAVRDPLTQAKLLVWIFAMRLVMVVASAAARSEEHTSELQSRQYLVCRLLLEKKKNKTQTIIYNKSIVAIRAFTH